VHCSRRYPRTDTPTGTPGHTRPFKTNHARVMLVWSQNLSHIDAPDTIARTDKNGTAQAVSQALAQAQSTGKTGALAQALSQAVSQGGGSAAQAVAEAYAQVC
jgi:hypothetical protein